MKHFRYIRGNKREEIFYKEPELSGREGDKEDLAIALGALLYMPATRSTWVEEVEKEKYEGLTSLVLDLEDALRDDEIEKGIEGVVEGIKKLEVDEERLPFIFVRVRDREQIKEVMEGLKGEAKKLTGFILPKFEVDKGRAWIEEVVRWNEKYGVHLYVMPVLESERIMCKRTRIDELLKIKELVDEYKEIVLNIRVGATDFTSLFGIRRTIDNTVYDMSVIRDCLVDIVNIFGRAENGYVVSGPVWEFFEGKNRVLKPQIRENLFIQLYGEEGKNLRKYLINEYVDGLIKEVLMDKINGFHGKTIIHPSHIKPVNSLLSVTYEEYMDALVIIEGEECGGVVRSKFSNKMNEVKPHMNWAKKIMRRAKIYGVLNEGKTFIDLMI